MKIKKEDWKFIGQICTIIIVIPLSLLFGFLWVQTFPLESGVNTYKLTITYLEGRTIENITTSDTIIEGMAFAVRFEVNQSKIYKVIQGYSSKGVCNEFAYVSTIANKTSELFWFAFQKEGFIGLAEVTGPFPDIFADMIAVGVLNIQLT